MPATACLAEMADRSGLTDALSEALAPMCKRRRRHDPGKVISDLAVTIAGMTNQRNRFDQCFFEGSMPSSPGAL